MYKLPSGIQLVGLFGSYARGTQDSYSDVDITYRISHNIRKHIETPY